MFAQLMMWLLLHVPTEFFAMIYVAVDYLLDNTQDIINKVIALTIFYLIKSAVLLSIRRYKRRRANKRPGQSA